MLQTLEVQARQCNQGEFSCRRSMAGMAPAPFWSHAAWLRVLALPTGQIFAGSVQTSSSGDNMLEMSGEQAGA